MMRSSMPTSLANFLDTFEVMHNPNGIANWSVTHVDWSEGNWHPKYYGEKDVSKQLLKNLTSITENVHVTSDARLRCTRCHLVTKMITIFHVTNMEQIEPWTAFTR